MPMQVTTPQSEIANYFEQQIQNLERAIVRNMCYVGEKCINAARALHTYKDQTGNLTSSIGYAVSINGRLVKNSSFSPVLNGKDGARRGKEYVQELIENYPRGIVLIVVAGMEYAYYVSDYGYDVLDSAESVAEILVPRMMKQLGLKV